MRLATCLILGLATCAFAGDWNQFRGPKGTAVSEDSGPPVTWSDTENMLWKAELPGPGSSSPVVAGDRIFVTCYSGYGVDRANPGDSKDLVRHVVCIDGRDGKILWDKAVPATVPEDRYGGMLAEHGYASSTPVTDGENVYVFFGKSGVYGFDREGKQLWNTSVGTGSAIMGWGSGASLTMHKDIVIVNANAESQSLFGLDKKTGSVRWKADAEGYQGSWSTPVLVDANGRQELAVYMPGEVWGLDPTDGGLLWHCGGLRGAPTTSLAVEGGVIYAVGGGPRGAGTAAIQAGGKGDVTKTHTVWSRPIGSYVPSPVVTKGHLFWVDDRGNAVCVDTASGEEVFRQRLPGERIGVYASVVAADGKLYAVTRRGGAYVLKAEPKFEVLAHNKLSDPTDFNATPAVSHGKLLLRSNKAIYCVGPK